MSDQSKLGLGKVITTEKAKDAIHVAVAPVVAAMRLIPGMHVGMDDQGRATNRTDKPIGVVDPFLQQFIVEGEKFWLFLYPGSITSLRHDWTHPAFEVQKVEPTSDKAESEKWLREYADKYYDYTDPKDRYEKLLLQLRTGEICYEGTDMHSLGDLIDAGELQKHGSIILGRPVIWSDFEYFSCTC
jgi:hypothetical protein